METLIDKNGASIAALLKYRNEHYEYLNQNITYTNIEAIKKQNILS